MNPSPPDHAPLVDSHAHLDDRRLRTDLNGVLKRAVEAGVAQIIAIGTTAITSTHAVELAATHRGVFAAVGIHPNDAAEAAPDDWDTVTALVNHPGVVAVGETGLDRYWKRTPFPEQQLWFDRHLNLAHAMGLPVVIHCRDCQRDILDQLQMLHRPVRGVMHAFTGTWDEAESFLELGLHVSFAGMVTFTNKGLDGLREVATRVPLDRLLVETDSPYLSPHPWRGQTNEPARVSATAARLAELRDLSYAELAQITTSNARTLFRLPDDMIL
jgi:TatD DNase family protein